MTQRFVPTALALAVLALCTHEAAHAQATSTTPPADPLPTQTLPTQTLPEVTVRASADASAGGLKPPYAGGQVARGGRVGVLGSQDIMDTPFNITNYTQALIQDQQAASVGDVLRNDPAVRVARGFGNFQQVYLVRGLPVFSDDMSYNGLYGLLPRQYLAAELLERVEVLRGASAFLNGAAPGGSGIGGAINVMPKRAPNEPWTEATLGVESGGQAYVAADVARRFGPDQSTGIRVNAVRRDGGTAVDREERELSVLSVGADYRARNLRVSADLGFQDHRLEASQPSVTFGAGVPILPAPDASRSLAQPWTRSNERDTFGTLRAEVDLAANVTAWAAGGFRRGHESAVFANPTVVSADATTSSFRFDNTREDTVATGELGVRGQVVTGSVKHTLVASMAVYQDKSKNAFALSNFSGFAGNLYSPSDVAPPPADAFVGGKLGDPHVTARKHNTSAALADTLSFAQDTVLLTLGVRHQKIEQHGYDYDTGAETSAVSSSRISPVAGLVVKAGRAVSAYANYIEGLEPGAVAPATTPTGQPVANAGKVFAPVQSKQVELGVKLDTGRFGGTFSVFQTRKPLYGVDPGTNRFEPIDRQRNRGVELSFFGEATPGLRLLGGASWLDTDVNGGTEAIGAPRSQFNLGAEWDVPGVPGLALNALATRTGSQYADAANTQVVPAWSRLDVGVRYATTVAARPVTLRARLDNVTDRSDWASAGGFPGAGYLVLGTPRTLVVSGSVAF